MTHFEAYLLTRLDSVTGFLNFLSVICVGFLFIAGISYIFQATDRSRFNSEKENEHLDNIKSKSTHLIKYALPSLIVIVFLNSLIPNTKEAAFIYIAPKIVNNQDLQESLEKIPELSKLGLEYLSETLKKEIKENK